MSGTLKWLRLRQRDADDARALPGDDAIDLINRSNRPFTRDEHSDETGLLVETGTPVQSVARVTRLTPLTTVIDGETFGIGDWYFEFNATDGTTASNAGVAGVAAQGTITLTGVPAATQQLVVGNKTYTFRAIADYDADAEIGIPASATAADQASYIVSAINGTDGYNTAHQQVTAKKEGSTVVLTSKFVGAGSDALVLTTTGTNVAVDGSGTLGGTTAAVDPSYQVVDIVAYADKAQGTLTLTAVPAADDTMTVGASVYTFKSAAAAAGQITIGTNTAATVANIVAAVNGDTYNTANASATAAAGGGGTVVFTAIVGGTAGNSIATTETFTPVGNVFDAATLGTTTAGTNPSVAEVCDAIKATIDLADAVAPFSATDNTTSLDLTSDLHGAEVNGWPLYDGYAGTIAQQTAGVAGTAGMQGAQLQDATYLYTLQTAVPANNSFAWFRVGHATF